MGEYHIKMPYFTEFTTSPGSLDVRIINWSCQWLEANLSHVDKGLINRGSIGGFGFLWIYWCWIDSNHPKCWLMLQQTVGLESLEVVWNRWQLFSEVSGFSLKAQISNRGDSSLFTCFPISFPSHMAIPIKCILTKMDASWYKNLDGASDFSEPLSFRKHFPNRPHYLHTSQLFFF